MELTYTDRLRDWYSPFVIGLTKTAAQQNDINRYKRLRQLSLPDSSKIQFMRKDLMNVEGPYEAFYVTAKYEYRPDILAYELYGSSLYAWTILQVNHMKSIYDMRAGTYIYVPGLGQAMEVN